MFTREWSSETELDRMLDCLFDHQIQNSAMLRPLLQPTYWLLGLLWC